jgi:probable addiction module antidote protein
MKSRPYKESLMKALQDTHEAAHYLSAAIEEGDEAVFLLALRDVVEARGGVGALAEKTGLNRENLYSLLSEKGNPRLDSLNAILHEVGLKMSVEAA